MKRIPIKAAKDVAEKFDASIVVIVAWDAKNGGQHVTTYGESVRECGWAAELGNQIKRQILKWPEEECQAKPDRRVIALKEYDCAGWSYGCRKKISKGTLCDSCEAEYHEDPEAFK